MSKKIDVNIGKWSGSVLIADPIYKSQAIAIETAMSESDESEIRRPPGQPNNVWLSVNNIKQLPAIIACVEEWHIQNFPDNPTNETFPFSPRKKSDELIAHLFREIWKVYIGEAQIPNE